MNSIRELVERSRLESASGIIKCKRAGEREREQSLEKNGRKTSDGGKGGREEKTVKHRMIHSWRHEERKANFHPPRDIIIKFINDQKP